MPQIDSIGTKFFKIFVTACVGAGITLPITVVFFFINSQLYQDVFLYMDAVIILGVACYYFYWVKDSLLGKIFYSIVAAFFIGWAVGLASVAPVFFMFGIPGGL